MRKCNGCGDCDNCHNMHCDEWIECDCCGERIDEEIEEVYGNGDEHYCEKCLLKMDGVFDYSAMIAYLEDSGTFNEYIEWLDISAAVKKCEKISFTEEELKKWLNDYINEDLTDYLKWYVEEYL